MELKKIHWIGIALSLLVLAASFYMTGTRFFLLLIGVSILILIAPFVLTVMSNAKDENEKETMFLEFARDLVESVKTGTPISKSIINIRNRGYGVLSPHIQKLANQIYLGIPLSKALYVFSTDVNSKSISRTITLIGESEKAGGDIGRILESVADAVNMTDKLKKERKASISTLVVQGYIIFFVFMIIVLVMQLKILPMISGIVNVGTLGSGTGPGVGVSNVSTSIDPNEVSNAFLFLLLVQGFFSGLAIGKLAEGEVMAGIKHSFALMIISFVVSASATI